MSSVKCGLCLEALDGDSDHLPTCHKCRYHFHFGKCSGIDAASWPKRGAENKKKWTCHICNPNKNLANSNSGVIFAPTFQANDSGVTPADDDISSPPQPIPQFNDLDSKCDYILSQVVKLVCQGSR